ncbi:MAG: glucoamylase family protein, partial [Steroidobacteraceae bacterium]
MALATLPEAMQRLAMMTERVDPPSSGELWDPERLYEHGRHLAEREGNFRGSERPDLNGRLKSNARALESAYGAIVAALQAGRAISPAAEWIVDNFHVISEQLGEVPLRLTPRVWRRLPATAHPQAMGWPRIYHIAREFLRYRMWEFHPESLVRLLDGYQELRPLRMEEIWGLYPILRIVLIDELRRVAVRVEDSLDARAIADDLADWLSVEESSGARISAAAELLSQAEPLPAPFTVQLVRRLHGMGKAGVPVLDAFAQGLARHDTSVDESIQRQHARRSTSNLAARNIITSLRQLASFDWRVLFEKTSHVEALLRSRADYLVCDRRTRDRYRHSIEDLAATTGRHEVVVTRQVLELLPAPAEGDTASSDLGSWLIGPQRPQLERQLRFAPSIGKRLRRGLLSQARGLYLGGIALATVALTVVAVDVGTDWPHTSVGTLLLLSVLAAFPASELAIGILNRVWLRAFPPRHLPRLALESGLQPQMKTLVVVPTLLRSAEDAVEACRQLQIHALANQDPHICFALLSDWVDSSTESRPEDAGIFAAAQREIARLNDSANAPPGSEPRFYLLHRRRQWSESEGRFIGWERKRGKLEELNRLLLGHGATSFLPDADGAVRAPAGVRYVLTVDADTRLPLGSVKDLVGVAVHPLNHASIDPASGRVTRGYGVLQPRITPLLPAIDERSLYREIVTSGSGIDPYAAAVSDLYQDVFGEGLFTGKGLYDLSAWDTALRGRIPSETLLSHDLFEGLFTRCGLVSDIEFFEDFPSNSEVAAARSHRWMRGDWQLSPWVLGLRGSLPPLGRWKMLDNMRRSLLAPAVLALLITAFAVTHSHPVVWLLLVLAPAVVPAIITALERLLELPLAKSRRMHLYRTVANLGGDLVRALVSLAMLAQNSWLAIDAIGRALYRLVVSRRHLLEWVTAAQLKAARSAALASFVWPMKSASIVVLAAVVIFLAVNHAALAQFSPLLLLWWLTPVLAQFLSRPLDMRRANEELAPQVERELRATARMTWTFFEQFVTAEDNFLPPDNFQEDPAPVIAHRSSPTNMGLYLLSTVAARDFGWLGLHDMGARLEATLASLQRLERYRGHFLNWYDTRTLATLAPKYVSTVDSGNLAGHLMTLQQACIRALQEPLLSRRALLAPLDAITNCRQALLEPQLQQTLLDASLKLISTLAKIELQLAGPHATLQQARDTLAAVAENLAAVLASEEWQLSAAAGRWLRVARQDIESQLRDLRLVPAAHAQLPAGTTLEQMAALAPAQFAPVCAALGSVARQCESLVAEMSFSFLLDRRRGLFSIGYRVTDGTLDESYYDLLASEARLASLVAIAKGDAPRSHWFRLGRRLTGGSARPVLASWSGSMFEYLMPALVMQEPRFSLLDQTNRRVVRQQIHYGSARRLPWGISESAYNLRDRDYTYQYSAFGVPTLGLKRGLSADYVIAPYATALAAMYMPVEANDNLRALAQCSGRGDYGFYEALDFTAGRVPNGQSVAVVHAYMAHHQGMSLVALDNVLNDSMMQERFHADPR